MHWITALAGALQDVLFPPRCAGCDGPVAAVGFCGVCRAGIIRAGLQHGPGLARVFACVNYAGPVRRALVRMKFHRDPAPVEALARLIVRMAHEDCVQKRVDAVVPMPLSTARLWWRGFNQSEALVRPLARALGRPLLRGHLQRRHRPPQAGLTARERADNVSEAFRAEALHGRAVLLFDDVLTTGATLAAAAEALRRGGARRVELLVLAVAPAPGVKVPAVLEWPGRSEMEREILEAREEQIR